MRRTTSGIFHYLTSMAGGLCLFGLLAGVAVAQETGTVTGTVTRAEGGDALVDHLPQPVGGGTAARRASARS